MHCRKHGRAMQSGTGSTLGSLLFQATYLGRNRIMTSPSPVAAAAPTAPSAYAPAPGIGESPTRLPGDDRDVTADGIAKTLAATENQWAQLQMKILHTKL